MCGSLFPAVEGCVASPECILCVSSPPCKEAVAGECGGGRKEVGRKGRGGKEVEGLALVGERKKRG